MAKRKPRPYGVYAKVRYQWLKENHPQVLAKLKREGRLQQYLDELQRAYCKKADALTEQYSREAGMDPEQADVDFVHYLIESYHVQQRVRDTLLPELQREEGPSA